MPEELEDKERAERLKVVEQEGSERISCEVSKVWLEGSREGLEGLKEKCGRGQGVVRGRS